MYDKPKKNINMFGKNIYAYITSLHIDNLFNLPQLLVLAFSLIKTGSIADKICIVSNDVSDDYCKLLEMFYKVIKVVDYKIGNNRYLKYYSLNLTNYKKILIINPNFVILQNPDFLFMTKTPAAYFRSKEYISTDLILLEPKVNEFDSMIFELSNYMINLDESEYIFNKYRSEKWTEITKDYFYDKSNIININKVKYIYYNDSPVDIMFADLNKDDIYLIWYDLYKDLLQKYPNLIDNKLLKGVNAILTQIMKNNLSRPVANTETDIINIKNIYDTNEIHINLQKYYHIMKDIEPPIDFDLFFDDDGDSDNDIMKPLNKLKEIYKFHHIDKDEITDDVFLIYFKSKKYIDCSIIEGDYTDDIKENKEIIFIKTLNLNKKMYLNLFFFINKDKTYENRINELEQKKFESEDEYKKYTFIFYKNIKNIKLNIKEVGELILNKNNIEFLKTTNVINLSSPFMHQNLLYIHTLRNWINSNLSTIEKERLILFGDIVLGTNGVKLINKIEGVFVSNGNDSSEYEKNLETLISDNLFKKSGFHFTRITKENSIEYNKFHKKIFDKIRKGDSIEFVMNSDNYYNFYGLKILVITLNMCYINSQKELDLKTDIVMTNIINRPLISRIVSYDKDKRIIKTNKKFKLSRKDILKIKNNAKNKFIKYYINKI